jgi:hypothetical protein
MTDEAQIVSFLAELRRVCDQLRLQFDPAARDLGRLLERLRHPELGDLRREVWFRVEQWDDETLIWTVAACGNFSVAMGAFDAAIKQYPKSRWLLRDGIRVCHEYVPISSNA